MFSRTQVFDRKSWVFENLKVQPPWVLVDPIGRSFELPGALRNILNRVEVDH